VVIVMTEDLLLIWLAASVPMVRGGLEMRALTWVQSRAVEAMMTE
jgi:hypothetical protein